MLTPVWETDNASIMNGIGQGSFAAALASSINIGKVVDEITKAEVTAKTGNMELNSLNFQDNIAKMNFTLEDARKGAREVGRMLEWKQLHANTSKSKYVIMVPIAYKRCEEILNIKGGSAKMSLN